MKFLMLMIGIIAFGGASLWATVSGNTWVLVPVLIAGVGLVAYARHIGETSGK